jgi:hypothetical protein
MRLAVFTSGARIRLAASAQIYLDRVLAPFRNLEASAIIPQPIKLSTYLSRIFTGEPNAKSVRIDTLRLTVLEGSRDHDTRLILCASLCCASSIALSADSDITAPQYVDIVSMGLATPQEQVEPVRAKHH